MSVSIDRRVRRVPDNKGSLHGTLAPCELFCRLQ